MDYNNELVKTGKLDVWGNAIDENASRTRPLWYRTRS